MTVYLLVLVGVIWGAIVFLVIRYLHKKFGRFRGSHIVAIILGLVGMSPLMAEYWHYHSFRQYCDVNAGWVLNEPVASDRLHVKAWEYDAFDALFSPKVREISFEPRQSWRLRFVGEYQGKYDPPQCRVKTIDQDNIGEPLGWMAERLAAEGVCLRVVDVLPKPDYMMEIVPLWDSLWPDDYADMETTRDYTFLLVDRRSGRRLSEYRYVSTLAGPFYRYVFQWPWARYRCEETNPFDRVLHQRTKYDVVKFLDKALLPVAD